MVQKFKVVPNEIVLEKPYLEKNIQFTRLAYRLQDIEDRQFPVEESLTRQDLRNNDLTVKNIRLWNHAPLLQTYSQLQEIRTYYKFMDVNNDRYRINGEYRQVALSPRELSYEALPSRSWVNEHIIYTHGYGAVLGPVNRISKEGLPEFFIKDIPPVPTTNIKISRPEIYYGTTSNEYVFVRTKRPEFDYPVGEKNVYSNYEGKGGVPLSFLKKLLFSYSLRFLYNTAIRRYYVREPGDVLPKCQGPDLTYRPLCETRHRSLSRHLPGGAAPLVSGRLHRDGPISLIQNQRPGWETIFATPSRPWWMPMTGRSSYM